jgi:hypothetical protein
MADLLLVYYAMGPEAADGGLAGHATTSHFGLVHGPAGIEPE